jgi:hypothetical protein
MGKRGNLTLRDLGTEQFFGYSFGKRGILGPARISFLNFHGDISLWGFQGHFLGGGGFWSMFSGWLILG